MQMSDYSAVRPVLIQYAILEVTRTCLAHLIWQVGETTHLQSFSLSTNNRDGQNVPPGIIQ